MTNSIMDMDGKLGVLPYKDGIEMPVEALNHTPEEGTIVGRMSVSVGKDIRTVNLYCLKSYWSERFACIYIITYYNCPWDGTKKEGKILKGWEHESRNGSRPI